MSEQQQQQQQQQQPQEPQVEIANTVSDIVSDTTVSGKLLQVIIDAVGKKPETGAEAFALLEYVFQKDIVPLLGKLRAWALEELSEKEAELVASLDKKMKACCLPKK
jgi:hypothetical protein